jgi:hypothetical protein
LKVAHLAACAVLTAALAAGADLAIQRLALHDYEDGPLITPGYEYLPGETVWLSVRVNGFQREVQDKDVGLDHVRITWQLRATDPVGTLIAPPLRGVVEETLRPEDKTWVPKVVTSFEVPQYAVRGIYKVPVTVRDDVAKTETAGQIEFRVRGEDAPPVGTPFGLRNFRFLATEDARLPLRPVVYKQGTSLFARFDMLGYKFEGNNHFSVDYGISILGPPNAEGIAKPLFTQESAAQEASESFYPRRWLPCGFRIDLEKDVPVGEHTLVLTLRDKLSNTTQEFRETFRVE